METDKIRARLLAHITGKKQHRLTMEEWFDDAFLRRLLREHVTEKPKQNDLVSSVVHWAYLALGRLVISGQSNNAGGRLIIKNLENALIEYEKSTEKNHA